MEKETVIVDSRDVVCSGPEEPHDHPIVWYVIPEHNNYAICFYCSKKFVYEKGDKKKI